MESWHFATSVDTVNLTQLLLNEYYLIENFMAFFKDKGGDLIAVEDRRRLCPYRDGSALILPKTGELNNKTAQLFMDETRPAKFKLHIENRQVSLSRREMQCLTRFSRGASAKQIADDLGLTYRTVQFYLSLAKDKVGVRYKTDLVQMLGMSG